MQVKILAAAAAAAFSMSAFAGECPADKRVPDGQGQKMVSHAAKGVTDVVRSSIDLAKEPLAVQGRQFRLRELNVQPGGIVPWHSHDQRPAQIYIVSGEIVEYASHCAVPIVHKAGEVAPEKAELVKLRFFAGMTIPEAAAALGFRPDQLATLPLRWGALEWRRGPGRDLISQNLAPVLSRC